MIRHIVLFKFRETDDKNNLEKLRTAMKQKLDALPAVIPVIRSFETGVNIHSAPGAWDLVLVSEFDSMETLEKYRNHPAHVEVVKFFRTVKDSSASVDYEY